jgi:hypothetical protein
VIIALFASLTSLCLYLGIRLHAVKTENFALSANIVLLKRRLNQRPL